MVVIEGSVVMTVPLVMTYGFGKAIVDGVPNLLGVGVGDEGVGVGGGGVGLIVEVLAKTTGFALAF